MAHTADTYNWNGPRLLFRLSVRPHLSVRLPLDEMLCSLIVRTSIDICRKEKSDLIKIKQNINNFARTPEQASLPPTALIGHECVSVQWQLSDRRTDHEFSPVQWQLSDRRTGHEFSPVQWQLSDRRTGHEFSPVQWQLSDRRSVTLYAHCYRSTWCSNCYKLKRRGATFLHLKIDPKTCIQNCFNDKQ